MRDINNPQSKLQKMTLALAFKKLGIEIQDTEAVVDNCPISYDEALLLLKEADDIYEVLPIQDPSKEYFIYQITALCQLLDILNEVFELNRTEHLVVKKYMALTKENDIVEFDLSFARAGVLNGYSTNNQMKHQCDTEAYHGRLGFKPRSVIVELIEV